MELRSCRICPRECGVNRVEGEKGYCMTDAGFNIASICIHRGEEPVISGGKGICNIFFSGCNLRCSYCQNHEISRGACSSGIETIQPDEILDRVGKILSQGVKAVGFVSPSHVVPQVKAIINGLHSRGLYPVTVYNTSSYDKPATIRGLAGLIDIYLPDFKYVSPGIAGELSDAPDYPEHALRVLKEMYYQKGSVLRTDESGIGENGMLIRHLVLPGYAEESMKVLRTVAEELSTGVNLSLMSQYHPTQNVVNHPDLRRSLYREEYESVVEEMEKLGFRNGWVQDLDSNQNYRPDFNREHPFE